MKELSNSELKDINGGFFPILIAAVKIVAAGVATLAAAGAVAYGVGYYDGKRECEQVPNPCD
jgi:lactobin A/cerein 7B family class IIb bacteriocin